MGIAEEEGPLHCDMALASSPSFTSRDVADRVESLLPALRRHASRKRTAVRDGVAYLRSCFAEEECPRIDYDRYSECFAYAFFLENYWKAVATFGKLGTPVAWRVVDLGCGSGAITLAYLATLEESLRGAAGVHGTVPVSVELIDRSKAQLDLATTILYDASPSLTRIRLELHPQLLDLNDWQPLESSADVVLLGHVLNENRPLVESLLQKAVRAARDGGRVFIIERKDDTVWEAIEKCLECYPLPTRRGLVGLATEEVELPAGHDARHKETIQTAFMELQVPQRKVLADVLRRYFVAWQTQSVGLLDAVFAPEARYHEKPDRPPLIGLDAIKGYWREKVLPQRDLRVRVLSSGYSEAEAFAEWEAQFRLGRQRVQVNGMLVLTVDHASGRAVALRECF
ncbi:MAG: nuclear transport factor 2 family protein, partial [Anaerolineae bacterium]|nr:nuclear transport factor 2 family protein [Anaerolineae bacterium]